MKNKSFVIHCDISDQLDLLTDAQAGALFRGAVRYKSLGKELSTDDGMVKVLFSVIKNQIDRDSQKYESVCERRREAGSKGGKQKVANASKCKQNVANVADSVSDSVSDSDRDSESTNVDTKKTTRFLKPTIQQLQYFISEKKYSVNAETFFNYYEANGWKIGKNPMKDWKAAVRTWQSKEKLQKPEIDHPFTNFKNKQQYDKF